MTRSRQIVWAIEEWPIQGAFVISRESRTVARVVSVTINEDGYTGRGECVPYPRYGETPESVCDAIERMSEYVQKGIDRQELARMMAAGAARNAIDCALWDLEAKKSGIRAHVRAGVEQPRPLFTAYTISLGTPEQMAQAARSVAHRPILKLKLGGDGDTERMIAVREAVPEARLILDANEAWREGNLRLLMETAKGIRAELIEQPLSADSDQILSQIERIVPVCADESFHTADQLDDLRDRYDCINIKLDKTGGLSGAISIINAARELGYRIMTGCMVSTSLSMAPAMIVAQKSDFVDLDGPLLLERDRPNGLKYDGSTIFMPAPLLWG